LDSLESEESSKSDDELSGSLLGSLSPGEAMIGALVAVGRGKGNGAEVGGGLTVGGGTVCVCVRVCVLLTEVVRDVVARAGGRFSGDKLADAVTWTG
jgi:hypothetical protein